MAASALGGLGFTVPAVSITPSQNSGDYHGEQQTFFHRTWTFILEPCRPYVVGLDIIQFLLNGKMIDTIESLTSRPHENKFDKEISRTTGESVEGLVELWGTIRSWNPCSKNSPCPVDIRCISIFRTYFDACRRESTRLKEKFTSHWASNRWKKEKQSMASIKTRSRREIEEK